ncbi:hypothetical protein F2Q70_00039349 [Brassica cretica]|uniref:Uncharacterized protein n=1 Tax=Brassica cretica TaxID=69181 RepID=A0A8S9K644_BRACR|nr:hypothetical protein F2Q70_00039349 [Brassica cretica]
MSSAGAGSSQGRGSHGKGFQGEGIQGEGQQPSRKAWKRKNRGPLDKFVMSLPPDIMKGRKNMKGLSGACDKELKDKVCEGTARWFYEVGISFNAATHDSF